MKHMKKWKLYLFIILSIGLVSMPTVVFAEEEGTGSGSEEPAKKTYTVRFDTDGGSSISDQVVEENALVTKPTDPSKKGYSLTGWKLGDDVYDFNSPVTSDITLKAVWEKVEVSNGYLASLKLEGLTFDQSFTKTNTRYTVTVPADTKTVKIIATAEKDSSVVIPDGVTKTLKDGKNTFTVIANSSVGGESNTYTIVVTRQAPDVLLESLKVTGYAFQEAFDSDKFAYTLEVPNNITEINVIAKASNDRASVKVTGDKNLQVGENKVVVGVSYETGTKQDYTIMVTRLEESSEDDKATSDIVTSSDLTPAAPSSTPKDGNQSKIIAILIVCILVFLLAGIGIFFYLKTETPEHKKKRMDKKLQKQKKKMAKVEEPEEEELETAGEDVGEVENLEEDLEQTLEAPVIDHSDILDGIEDLF